MNTPFTAYSLRTVCWKHCRALSHLAWDHAFAVAWEWNVQDLGAGFHLGVQWFDGVHVFIFKHLLFIYRVFMLLLIYIYVYIVIMHIGVICACITYIKWIYLNYLHILFIFSLLSEFCRLWWTKPAPHLWVPEEGHSSRHLHLLPRSDTAEMGCHLKPAFSLPVG